MTTLIASWFLFVLETDTNCLCQFTSLLPSAKLSRQAKPAIQTVRWKGAARRTKAADEEREAVGILISFPVLHCILINLTDFSKMELTLPFFYFVGAFFLSLSRSIVLMHLAVSSVDSVSSQCLQFSLTVSKDCASWAPVCFQNLGSGGQSFIHSQAEPSGSDSNPTHTKSVQEKSFKHMAKDKET